MGGVRSDEVSGVCMGEMKRWVRSVYKEGMELFVVGRMFCSSHSRSIQSLAGIED